MSDPTTSNVVVNVNGSTTSSVSAGESVSNGAVSNGTGSNGNQPTVVVANGGVSTNGSNGGHPNNTPSNGAHSNGAPSNAASSNGGGSVSNGIHPDDSAKRGAPFEVFTFDADRQNGDRNGGRLLASLTSAGNGDHPTNDVADDSALFAVDRPAAEQPGSSIYLDAFLEGNRSARDVLVGKIIDELTPLGLTAERLTPNRSRLRSSDGRTVAVTARALTADEDRIEIVLDTSLAGQVFTALRQWHRVELDATDQMRLSARIR